MSWADLIKVLSGVFLAIALMVGGCFFAAQYVIAQFTAPPPRPTFPNDSPSTSTTTNAATTNAATTNAAASNNAAVQPKVQPKPSASPVAAQSSPQPSPQPSVSPKPSPQPSETAGYHARITLSQGLNLRESPGRDAARVGGVAGNTRITVLEESPDREWQRIRLEGSGQEGWVKAGYTERVNQ